MNDRVLSIGNFTYTYIEINVLFSRDVVCSVTSLEFFFNIWISSYKEASVEEQKIDIQLKIDIFFDVLVSFEKYKKFLFLTCLWKKNIYSHLPFQKCMDIIFTFVFYSLQLKDRLIAKKNQILFINVKRDLFKHK